MVIARLLRDGKRLADIDEHGQWQDALPEIAPLLEAVLPPAQWSPALGDPVLARAQAAAELLEAQLQVLRPPEPGEPGTKY